MTTRVNFLLIFGLMLILVFHTKETKAQIEGSKLNEELSKIEGRVTVYYPDLFESEASEIQKLIELAIEYYNHHLKINIPISVFLLGPEEFEKYSKERWGSEAPYNTFLPFVVPGTPASMYLPLNAGSALDFFTLKAIEGSPSIIPIGSTSQEMSQRFTTLVGLHELGHQYMRELKITQPVHWFQEMMANFIADAFLLEASPADAKLWISLMEAYENNLIPTNKTFSGIHKGGQENYVWWQGNTALLARELYNIHGLDFIQKMQDFNNEKIFQEDDPNFIIALDVISPGFKQWALKYDHF
ncbi:hypothetical protein U3A58_08375 [Algoriphagus sp. C2-6-M1]|uniref:hypothetical protein n=1 Tax=Algoriphagus persicinus TaxID=3108754 RepID=UPI002B3B1F73|nr:hypothetical protein [Algoriphagus sp. C2-6-M1]MEB2780408.1 hypothetical protein [Algoriphagus sp. C2-6-M1]